MSYFFLFLEFHQHMQMFWLVLSCLVFLSSLSCLSLVILLSCLVVEVAGTNIAQGLMHSSYDPPSNACVLCFVHLFGIVSVISPPRTYMTLDAEVVVAIIISLAAVTGLYAYAPWISGTVPAPFFRGTSQACGLIRLYLWDSVLSRVQSRPCDERTSRFTQALSLVCVPQPALVCTIAEPTTG